MQFQFGVRAGFTLMELLVATAVISVLVALALPSVQSARATSRKLTCSNRQKQLCLAVQNYHGTYREMPRRSYPTGGSENPWDWRGHSVQTMLLPYLEHGSLFAMLDFDRHAHTDAENEEIAWQVVGEFLCPADSEATVDAGVGRRDPGCNFAFCLGANVGFSNDGVELDAADENGMITNSFSISLADVTDGASNVVLLSEQVKAAHSSESGDSVSRLSMYRYAPGAMPPGMPLSLPSPNKVVEWAVRCTLFEERGRHVARKWHRGLPGQTLFNTLLPPNAKHPNCSNHCASVCDPDGPGLFTARSRHASAVNAGFVDGRVESVSDNVDHEVWMRLGARNDGDSVNAF